MRLYYDLNRGTLVRSPNDLSPVTLLNFKRGNSAKIELSFCRSGSVVELDFSLSEALGKFMLKEQGKYDGDAVVSALTWTKSGEGASTIYTFEPNFNTTALNTLIGHNPPETSDDKASVRLMGEIKWLENGLADSTPVFTAVVANNVIKDAEGLPVDANPGYWNKDEADARYLRGQFALATIGNGAETVDVDISAASLDDPPTHAQATVLLPATDSPALIIAGVYIVDTDTIRIRFAGEASTAGYQASVLFQ